MQPPSPKYLRVGRVNSPHGPSHAVVNVRSEVVNDLALEAAAGVAFGDADDTDAIGAGTVVAGAAADAAGEAPVKIELKHTERALDVASVRYDRAGDQHYDVASAFIKSIRGSDVDAALHYLARMLEAGEDPRFVARRIVIDVNMTKCNECHLVPTELHSPGHIDHAPPAIVFPPGTGTLAGASMGASTGISASISAAGADASTGAGAGGCRCRGCLRMRSPMRARARDRRSCTRRSCAPTRTRSRTTRSCTRRRTSAPRKPPAIRSCA